MRKALVCLLLALACTAHAETITGQVVGVADGDTVIGLGKSLRIRLTSLPSVAGRCAKRPRSAGYFYVRLLPKFLTEAHYA